MCLCVYLKPFNTFLLRERVKLATGWMYQVYNILFYTCLIFTMLSRVALFRLDIKKVKYGSLQKRHGLGIPRAFSSIAKTPLALKTALPNNENSPNLLRIRHSTAHVMAMAVQRLYPKVKVTIGPWIENG